MQQEWVAFWRGVNDAAHHALWPFRAVAEALGIQASDLRIWLFLCAIFILAIAVSATYGDLVLRRRGVLAAGQVIRLNEDSDGIKTPTIEFADASGKVRRFDSALPVNRATRAIGSAVTIMYDPRDPARAREVGRPLMKAFQMILWWSVTCALLGAVYFAA